MEKLPCEILDKILSFSCIGIEDLFHLASTSKTLQDAVTQNNFRWKAKFKKRWPHLYSLQHQFVDDWCIELRSMYQLRKKARNLLKNMSEDYFPPRELTNSELEEWSKLVRSESEYYYTFQFLLEYTNDYNFLEDINPLPFLTRGNLTLRYYISRVVYFIVTGKLENDWKILLSKPEEYRTLEEAAIILAQRFQFDLIIIPEIVSKELDCLAQKVKDYLKQNTPDHPLFSVPHETLETWKRCNHKEQQFSAEDSMVLLEAIVDVLCKQQRFGRTSRDYFNSENFLISSVLNSKHGSVITLSIIYNSVARRLGIHLQPVTYRTMHFLQYTHGANYLVNVLRGTITITDYNCDVIDIESLTISILRNMNVGIIKNEHRKYGVLLKRAIFEWKLIVEPQNPDTLLDLAETYGEMGVNQSKLFPYFKFQDENNIPDLIAKCTAAYNNASATKRNALMEPRINRKSKYAIGMVMRLTMCGSLCVICDWEPNCANLSGSIGRLTNYTVLFDDGSCHNIPECFLDVALYPRAITHPELGVHFTHYCMTHYVPHEVKEKYYPGDRQIRLRYHQQIRKVYRRDISGWRDFEMLFGNM